MSTIVESRTVTADGRTVVPWAIQEALGVEYGGQICFRLEDGIVTLHNAEELYQRKRRTGHETGTGGQFGDELKSFLGEIEAMASRGSPR